MELYILSARSGYINELQVFNADIYQRNNQKHRIKKC